MMSTPYPQKYSCITIIGITINPQKKYLGSVESGLPDLPPSLSSGASNPRTPNKAPAPLAMLPRVAGKK